MQTTDKPKLSTDQQSSRIIMQILYRVDSCNINMAQYRILLALSGNVGASSVMDISKATGSAFNWGVAEPLQDAGLLSREYSMNDYNKRKSYKFTITEYGKKTLKYIATGKK